MGDFSYEERSRLKLEPEVQSTFQRFLKIYLFVSWEYEVSETQF